MKMKNKKLVVIEQPKKLIENLSFNTLMEKDAIQILGGTCKPCLDKCGDDVNQNYCSGYRPMS